jgi:outer membrane protein insertion porin family
MAGVGYSQVQGIVLNANISQDNVFGSGKRVNLAFNNSDYLTSYQFGFHNPYFTTDGVSQGYNLGYSSRNAGAINISNYNTDVVNAGINFGLPINEFDQIRFDLDGKYTTLKTTAYSSDQIRNFLACKSIKDCGNSTAGNNNAEQQSYFTFAPSIGWTHDTLNRAIFPTSGWQQRLSALATVPGSDLEYYKTSYKHQMYFPIAKDLTFRLHGEAGYGDGYGDTDELPFFENYFAGGTGSVRGFKNNTLGPRETRSGCSTSTVAGTINPCAYRNYSIGGSTKVIANAELFFPVPFMSETKSVRLGTFFDAGSLSSGLNVDNMKYSAGVSGEWMSPFGALSVSAAMPLNANSQKDTYGNPIGDEKQIFQFNFGQNF